MHPLHATGPEATWESGQPGCVGGDPPWVMICWEGERAGWGTVAASWLPAPELSAGSEGEPWARRGAEPGDVAPGTAPAWTVTQHRNCQPSFLLGQEAQSPGMTLIYSVSAGFLGI